MVFCALPHLTNAKHSFAYFSMTAFIRHLIFGQISKIFLIYQDVGAKNRSFLRLAKPQIKIWAKYSKNLCEIQVGFE
ncbi:hypothetical protein B0181_06595 [Moraxella caviae]|uniref:Uncharacterized protein n=1 Tax=Moraxella caviae TaxID=34060 RepID=A0A1T0A2V0_9GAMM|nr:hypothetical protein B0181_06595 [Moraxella caviae]